jgi:hypothetical protein
MAQTINITKIIYNTLYEVSQPYIPLKSKFAKISYDVVSDREIIQQIRFCKAGFDVLDLTNIYVEPDTTNQYLRNSKLAYSILLKVLSPYVPLKSKFAKISYDVISDRHVIQQTRICKAGFDILVDNGAQTQQFRVCKAGFDVLDCVEPYRTTYVPVNDWFDANWLYRQKITLESTTVDVDVNSEWVGLLFDETGNALFGRNYQ